MEPTETGDLGSDLGSGDEYEEVLLYVSYPERALAFNKSTAVALAGLETSCPSCTFAGMRYDGEYSVSVGTRVFYRVDKPSSKASRQASAAAEERAASSIADTIHASGATPATAGGDAAMDVSEETAAAAAAAAAAAPEEVTSRGVSFVGTSERILTLAYGLSAGFATTTAIHKRDTSSH